MGISDIVAVATTIVICLTGGIVALFKSNQRNHESRIKRAEDKLDKCELDHKRTQDDLLRIVERLATVEQTIERRKEYRATE
jgi:hypothetical protein